MSTSPDRMVAGLVGDRYEITGLIATGGMGSVYRARDSVLDRIVALKVLKAGADDPSFVARFRSEATNAARLSHPNIVQVFDFGYADERPYMAMEYVDGQNLREILTARVVLAPEQAARIGQQVAAALEHARKAGIVHRDVKPENILVTTDGTVKVADFGLSRAFAEAQATQSGMLMGTAHYLSPEQVQGGHVDHRTDIYALGVVLYEMLTGRAPFSGDSPVVIAYKRVAEDVPSIMADAHDAPRDLDIIVARATARMPDERYTTAGEMADALRAFLPRHDTASLGGLVHHTQAIPLMNEETIALQRPAAGAVRTKKRTRRRRKGLIFVMALVLLAGAAFATTARLAKDPVPSVLTMSQEDAETKLRAAGFDVRTTFRNDDEVREGYVITQEPTAGIGARPGSVVQIFVSLGPELFRVPDVGNKTYKRAAGDLKELGLTVRRVDEFHPSVKKGSVISQSPDAGVRLEKGQQVTLTVSKGPELFAVPNVKGSTEAEAIDDLEQIGFEVKIDRKRSDTPKGEVISQSPKAGTKLADGATVTIVVSQGPPLVAVPNLDCMTRDQAEDVAASKGFTINFESNGRRVVDQDPAAGTKLAKGSTITAYTGPGTRC